MTKQFLGAVMASVLTGTIMSAAAVRVAAQAPPPPKNPPPPGWIDPRKDRKSTRLNSSHSAKSRMPSSA